MRADHMKPVIKLDPCRCCRYSCWRSNQRKAPVFQAFSQLEIDRSPEKFLPETPPSLERKSQSDWRLDSRRGALRLRSRRRQSDTLDNFVRFVSFGSLGSLSACRPAPERPLPSSSLPLVGGATTSTESVKLWRFCAAFSSSEAKTHCPNHEESLNSLASSLLPLCRAAKINTQANEHQLQSFVVVVRQRARDR